MARQYEGRFPHAPAFVKMRLRRLWPTMALGGLLGALVFASQMPPLGAVVACLMGLLLVPWLGSDKGLFPLNPPTWSILFELLANALHAALFHRIGTRWLVGAAGASAALLLVLAPSLDVGSVRAHAEMGIPRVVMSYALGIALWRLRHCLSSLPGWLGLTILPLAIFVLPLLPVSKIVGDLLFALVIGPLAMIAGLAQLGFARLFLVRLGWLSFPLYAVHYPVLMFVGQWSGPLVAAVAAVGVAWIAGLVVERVGQIGSVRQRTARDKLELASP